MVIQNSHGTILPGRHLHHVFKVACLAPLDVSVVDRHDLQAEACLDSEGWCVIILTNVTDVPVSITPLEPIHLVITPSRRASEVEWKKEVDDWKREWLKKRSGNPS
jgi:hypothetical protein